MLVVYLLALQAFVAKQPFDIAEAEIEILEGPFIEYSGPDYALFKYYMMMKQMFYAWLFVAVFIPIGRTGFYPLNILLQLLGMLVVFVLIALVGSTNPRLRIDQAVKYLRRPDPRRARRGRAGGRGSLKTRGRNTMWLTSKIKQVLMVMKPGVVTLKYPFEPRPAPENFRGAPHWDHHEMHRLRRLRQPLPGPDDHGPGPLPGDPGAALRRLALHLLRPLRRGLPGEGHRHDRRGSSWRPTTGTTSPRTWSSSC